jgi:protein-tyrosine phosphatase
VYDFHCHLLPDCDDGAIHEAESLAMAEYLEDNGISRVYCTPHRQATLYETSNEQIRIHVDHLKLLLRQRGLKLSVETGCEYHLDEFFPALLSPPQTLGSSALILVELPFGPLLPPYLTLLSQAVKQQLSPLIAHPERCYSIQQEISPNSQENPLVDRLLSMGCRLQCNLGSFTGFHGKKAKETAEKLLVKGLYHCLGSDGHTKKQLEQVITPGLARIASLVGSDEAHRLAKPEWAR